MTALRVLSPAEARVALAEAGARVPELERILGETPADRGGPLTSTGDADLGSPDGASGEELGRAVHGAPQRHDDAVHHLLDEVLALLVRYLVLGEHQADAIVLWIAHAHAIAAADVTLYLDVTSPVKGCGKTTLLELAELLVPRPLRTANISDAALFRSIANEDGPATVLLDEADAIFGPRSEREDLRALMNAGYRRGAVVARCEVNGKRVDVVRYDAFGPKALAAIGHLPETIADRSIPIRMRRRARSEPIERFRYRIVSAEAGPIRDALADWAAVAAPALRDARPELPDALGDRAQDGWEPLFAIADAAGPGWGDRARRAAVELHGDEQAEDPSLGALLLTHVRDAFGSEDRITTAALLAHLIERDEGPWARWWADHVKAGRIQAPASDLAKRLRPFGIVSKQVRTAERSGAKGYLRESFEDAWNRYVNPPAALIGAPKVYTSTPQAKGYAGSEALGTESASDLHSRPVDAKEALQRGETFHDDPLAAGVDSPSATIPPDRGAVRPILRWRAIL